MKHVDTRLLLPKGIRIRGSSLEVQSTKTHFVNGEKKTVRKFTPVKLELPMQYTEEQFRQAVQDKLEEAKKIKILQDQTVSSKGYATRLDQKVRAVGTLGEVYEMCFEERWQGTEQERNVKIYIKDIFNYFPPETRLDVMQTHENKKGFVEFCRQQIKDRAMNNLGSVSNTTINRRLSVLRCIFAYAIEHRMLEQKDVLNPDHSIKNYGWRNESYKAPQKKDPLTEEEIQSVIDEANFEGQYEFADAFAWLVDTGMRHKGEFENFTIHNVNFKNKTVKFYRPKTKSMSVNIPLTDRAFEIVSRRKQSALQNPGGRVFMLSYAVRRRLFDHYKQKLNLPVHFTPYATRHTFITRLVEAGVNERDLCDLAGHTSIETSMTYYASSTAKSLGNAISKINVSKPRNVDTNSMIGHNSGVLKKGA